MSAALHIPRSSPPEPYALRNLRAVVLLAGAVRQARLDAQVGRPIFDLPLDKDVSILDSWRSEVQRLAEIRGGGALPVRIMMNKAAELPLAASSRTTGAAAAQVERDPFDYRGAGGVLRDVAIDYQDQDYLLVANAAQVLMRPLADLCFAMAEMGGDVVIVSHVDGTPSGLSMVRCGAVRDLPATGFVDFKEQALPAIAARHEVKVLQLDQPSGLPVRTLSDYIAALRRHHQRRAGMDAQDDPFAEGWESAFVVVEDGAEVHPEAQLSDSVVLRGGKVEAEAVLARSVVCPGGAVQRKKIILDALVTPGAGGQGRS